MAETKEPGGQRYKPYVPAEQSMKEFTLKAMLIGLAMCIVLGAANAYLGLKAGMTIAATYPAAVIGMAVLRIFKGNILEENMARTVGSIGEAVAAGAIFTIPAFFIAGVWLDFGGAYLWKNYLIATIIMMLGGVIGILFVTMLRRVMVEDVDLPYPESVAASEIHKAGRRGGTGAFYLFGAMALGAIIQAAKELSIFAARWEKFIPFAKKKIPLLGSKDLPLKDVAVQAKGGAVLSSPGVSPAYIGVGYIIGPELASLTFAGGLLSWGLFVPMLLYFLGPDLESYLPGSGNQDWLNMSLEIWKYIVRPMAIGGMLMSAIYTLWRMRRSLIDGIKRSISDVRKAATGDFEINRIEHDISLKYVFPLLIIFSFFTFLLYYYFAKDFFAALVAMIVMIIAGFFFSAVSGYLVGLIGSSNNPISGLTLSTLLIAAVLMVILGMKGMTGVAAVLGVAAVICVAAAVAGEMLQDLKVGHILGGTPWKMQVGDLIGVVVASAFLFFPLLVLHEGDIKEGGIGFGGRELPAPQASLMALLSKGIVGGEMAWPLIIIGIVMAIGFILVRVKSPMLICVGMYLPLETTFAIFVGGMFRGILEKISDKRKYNAAQKTRMENNGVLLAAGFIAGEALIGLLFAFLAFREMDVPALFAKPSFITSLFVFAIIGLILVISPLKNAGSPDEPAPPSAV